jgi:hypothetical protein
MNNNWKSEIKLRLEKMISPFRTAEKFAVKNIIDPRAIRKILCDFVKLVMRGESYLCSID